MFIFLGVGGVPGLGHTRSRTELSDFVLQTVESQETSLCHPVPTGWLWYAACARSIKVEFISYGQ